MRGSNAQSRSCFSVRQLEVTARPRLLPATPNPVTEPRHRTAIPKSPALKGEVITTGKKGKPVKSIHRSTLLELLSSTEQHVLLCAPHGYGKSVLLEQFRTVTLGAVLLDANRINPAALLEMVNPAVSATEARTLLVDHADALERGVVAQLINLPSHQTKLVLSVHHLDYPRLQLLRQRGQLSVVGTSELAFTLEETRQLHTGGAGEEIFARTLGWPYATSIAGGLTYELEGYVEDLLGELPEELRERLTQHLDAGDAPSLGALVLKPGLAIELAKRGFPLLALATGATAHPLIAEFLWRGKHPTITDLPRDEREIVGFKGRLESMSLERQLEAIEGYFGLHDVDDVNVTEKIEILGSVPLLRLSPAVRDIYASYLNDANQTSEAIGICQAQRSVGAASTRTYTILARIASTQNDLAGMHEYLILASEQVRANSSADRSRLEHQLALYFVRLDRFEDAIQHADLAYREAIVAGSPELHINALTAIGYVQQLNGNLAGAMSATREALVFVQTVPKRFALRLCKVISRLSDILKDAGQYEEALELIKRGLQTLKHPSQGSAPLLYTTRGLIYLEIGEFEPAISAFESAIAGLEASKFLPYLMLPHTYLGYAAYRLGQITRLEKADRDLQNVFERSRARMTDEYREFERYRPLLRGLLEKSRGRPQAALEAFAEVNPTGGWTYDSVLLIKLEAGLTQLDLGALEPAYPAELKNLLTKRNTPGNAIVLMYRAHYAALLEACASAAGCETYFKEILDAPLPALPIGGRTFIELRTLGKLELWVQQSFVTKKSYPLSALCYLILKGRWVTRRELAHAMFANGETDAQRAGSLERASVGVNLLKKMLSAIDAELERNTIESDPELGYRIPPSNHVSVVCDVAPYLSLDYQTQHPAFRHAAFSPLKAWALLERVETFKAGGESEFNTEINHQLSQRTESVALHLSELARQGDQHHKAIRALLLGVRLTRAEPLIARLRQHVTELFGNAATPEQLLEQLEALLANLIDDADHLERQFEVCLALLEQTELAVARSSQ